MGITWGARDRTTDKGRHWAIRQVAGFWPIGSYARSCRPHSSLVRTEAWASPWTKINRITVPLVFVDAVGVPPSTRALGGFRFTKSSASRNWSHEKMSLSSQKKNLTLRWPPNPWSMIVIRFPWIFLRLLIDIVVVEYNSCFHASMS